VMWEIFPQGIGTPFERACRLAMDQKIATTYETPSRLRPDRVLELRIVPMADQGIAVVLDDITERRLAAEAARAANARATEILESVADAFYAMDADWRLTYVNRRAEAWWGRTRDELLGKVMWEEFPQAVGSASHAAHLQAAAERRVMNLETVSPVIHRWIDLTIHPTADGGLSVFFRDITDRKRAEEARELLMREVDHRARNMLSVIQSIVQLTRTRGLLAYKDQVLGRISALARAQGLLAHRRWEGAALASVVQAEMAALGRAGGYEVTGPDLSLPAGAVQSLSMILHELATNARKYGAFSTDAGHVAIEWSLRPDGRLRLAWTETGGPPTVAPAHRGFGSRLIHDLARQLGGEARFHWRPEGLDVEIVVALE
jgi:PAS domain S-box-containing protein